MELIKDIIKVDNRIDFGKFQTFIETEAVVPDKKSDVYEIIKTEGYISLKKVELTDLSDEEKEKLRQELLNDLQKK